MIHWLFGAESLEERVFRKENLLLKDLAETIILAVTASGWQAVASSQEWYMVNQMISHTML